MTEKHGRLYDLYLSGRGIALYHQLFKHSQYWPYEKLIDFQFNKLKYLLISASQNTRYYRDLFLEINFNPFRDFNEISDIRKIPILTQSNARQNKDLLVNGTKLEQAIELSTSGTTGEPFITYASPEHWITEQAIVWRHWKWAGYKFRDKMVILRSYVPQKNKPLWKFDNTRNFLYLSAYHISESSTSKYVDILKKWKPKFLRGYPGSLYLLAKFMKAKSLTIKPPAAILTASEMLLPHYRETIENTFNAPVFDWYGMGEPAVTLSECQTHKGLHINMEYGLCELIPDSSLPSDHRRIVATCLNNDVMPLIRYDTKDIAVIYSNNKCSCGRNLPLIKKILGRSDDFLYGSEERILPGVNFYTLFYHYSEIIRFQIIQNSLSNIEVRIEHSEDFTETGRLNLMKDLKDRFGDEIKIDLVENEGFIQVGEGKTPVLLQKVKNIEI
jgi:phenylacetate-CoA ligase